MSENPNRSKYKDIQVLRSNESAATANAFIQNNSKNVDIDKLITTGGYLKITAASTNEQISSSPTYAAAQYRFLENKTTKWDFPAISRTGLAKTDTLENSWTLATEIFPHTTIGPARATREYYRPIKLKGETAGKITKFANSAENLSDSKPEDSTSRIRTGLEEERDNTEMKVNNTRITTTTPEITTVAVNSGLYLQPVSSG